MLTISIQVTFKGGGVVNLLLKVTISVLIFQSFPGTFRHNYVCYERKWGGGLMPCGLW